MSGRSRGARGALLVLFAAALAASASAGNGGPACPDRTPLPIAAPGDAGAACQKAIAKEGAKFLKTKTSALSKCLLKQPTGACPTAADVAKVEQAAQKAAAGIAKKCGDDAAQAALASSYSGLADDAAIGSCMLSQHNAVADLLVLNATGISTGDWPGVTDKARGKCIAEASKTGIGLGLDLLAAAAKCIDKQIKAGTAGDLAAVCLGAIASGNFVLPSDAKTADKIDKIISSAASKIDKKCRSGEGSWLPSVFACDGAATAADLSDCLKCRGYQSAIDFVEQQYAEGGGFVDPGADAIENAVNAASPGTKLLIRSGTYEDPATIEQSGLQLVGCGGATNERPRIARPAGCSDDECANGILANGVDGLLFQSLEVEGWDQNGIFVAGITGAPVQGVTFRDIVGIGGAAPESPDNSRYAVFPRDAEGVLIEGCDVRDISDAGIYVGQSSDIVVRFNKIRTSVAGIEFENSAFGVAHNNYATDNTGGMLVFLDGNLPAQFSNDHRVAHNVFVDNNGANFGSGSVAGVPVGTGVLVISDDDSVYEYNVITGNDSFGFGLIDQVLAEFNISVDPEDIKATGASVHDNVVTGNGGNPDDEAPFPADMLMGLTPQFPLGTPLYGDPPVHDNCFADNIVDQDPIFLFPALANQCP
jgi:parallel beta-helix repeat protein